MNTILMPSSTPEVGRTILDRHVVLRELRATGSGVSGYFRAGRSVAAEAGAHVWTEGAELVVRHPDARVTRQRGLWCLDA